MFLKKHKWNIHDWKDSGRDGFMWFYNLYYTEYHDKVKEIEDFEVSARSHNFDYSFEIDYGYKGIELDINDLPWFLTRNRYLINKNCYNPWYYTNFKYYFKSLTDCDKMKNIFKKTNTITEKENGLTCGILRS